MFDRLSKFFKSTTPPPQPLPEMDARYAMGTLLVRVAMADQAYLFEEIETIDKILAKAHDMNPLDAAKMRAVCEKLAAGIEDDEHMAHLIREGVDYAHRLEKVQALWDVARSDGFVNRHEAEIVSLVERSLGITGTDAEAARAGTD